MKKHERHRMLLNAAMKLKEFYIFDSTPGDTTYYENFTHDRVSLQTGSHHFDDESGNIILHPDSAIAFYLRAEERLKYSKIKLMLSGDNGGNLFYFNQVSAFGESQYIEDSTSAQEYVFEINTNAPNFVDIESSLSGTVSITSIILE